MTAKDSLSPITLVLEAPKNPELLAAKLRQVEAQDMPPADIRVVFPADSEAKLPAGLPAFSGTGGVKAVSRVLPSDITTPFLAYLPANAPYSLPLLEGREKTEGEPFLQPWVPPVTLRPTDWARQTNSDLGWICSSGLFRSLALEELPGLLGLERISREKKIHLPYFSAPANAKHQDGAVLSPGLPALSGKSRVLALVPYFNCEDWLEECLDSLASQTRPPDAIAVLDDASSRPPLEIVRKFNQVTLLRSPDNGGPYRLLQSVIDQTRFDGYLFQDADDWSSRDRLERLLQEAERTGAEWIGAQEFMYFENSVHAPRYPLDLNAIRESAIRHPFCYPSSLISRNFLTKLGGFATGLRFSGDWELLTRAVWAGKVVNLDRYCYFRRIRKDSLITSEATGLGSQARREVDQQIEARKAENRSRFSQGLAPLLEPLKTVPPVVFGHLAGPSLI